MHHVSLLGVGAEVGFFFWCFFLLSEVGLVTVEELIRLFLFRCLFCLFVFPSATGRTERVQNVDGTSYLTDLSAGTIAMADPEPPNLTIAKVLIILHIPCIDAKSAKTELLKLINKRERKKKSIEIQRIISV